MKQNMKQNIEQHRTTWNNMEQHETMEQHGTTWNKTWNNMKQHETT